MDDGQGKSTMGTENKRRILVISQSVDLQKIARLSLELSVDWIVVTVSSVDEGLALSQASPPDVILLDVDFFEDEYAALNKLCSDPSTRRSRTIVMASRVRSIQQHLFSQRGATAVISHPFNPAELAQQIATASGWTT